MLNTAISEGNYKSHRQIRGIKLEVHSMNRKLFSMRQHAAITAANGY